MARVLLVSNDFPPTIGGIQSYLRDFVAALDPHDVVVFASTQDRVAAELFDAHVPYRVYRQHRKVMLPTWSTIRTMQEIIRREKIDTVWFGASAPLALMARWAKAAGAKKIIATTHGHEVGWSMIPGARQVLGVIGRNCDVVTYIADYTLRRFKKAFGQVSFEHLPSGVDIDRFHVPDAVTKQQLREQFCWQESLVVLCSSRLTSRKGQDMLIKAWPAVAKQHPHARLVIIGAGSYEAKLRALAAGQNSIEFAGRVSEDTLVKSLQAADIFAMPVRTRGGGLDVEGLGIVYLEAQACGLPIIAGNSGGAPETVNAESGIVVDGRSLSELITALHRLLSDTELRANMGKAGRENVEKHWQWAIMQQRLRRLIEP
ncbi:Mannosyltransferase [Corynebacterium kutscheri]|uniref:Glycosyltransferase n=1 Tax=Corynebacterium kutscheri TaxID=35755 RepID=A0A0F6R2D6_9CORY|nr:glycosyltransferase family 4 protein [Corynebacterium kutscheri]AKE41583.1 glycosyltransferase [Corynebacterium kutscheri]VEH08862.1 Mannosyltransferase [Corynebacterium kutscheri]VEH09907.1 Mannosyltransferase [Corynebacterium kutscheri]VEH79991.1 Mannosyltransferase [Corynebacterium kutscheri]